MNPLSLEITPARPINLFPQFEAAAAERAASRSAADSAPPESSLQGTALPPRVRRTKQGNDAGTAAAPSVSAVASGAKRGAPMVAPFSDDEETSSDEEAPATGTVKRRRFSGTHEASAAAAAAVPVAPLPIVVLSPHLLALCELQHAVDETLLEEMAARSTAGDGAAAADAGSRMDAFTGASAPSGIPMKALAEAACTLLKRAVVASDVMAMLALAPPGAYNVHLVAAADAPTSHSGEGSSDGSTATTAHSPGVAATSAAATGDDTWVALEGAVAAGVAYSALLAQRQWAFQQRALRAIHAAHGEWLLRVAASGAAAAAAAALAPVSSAVGESRAHPGDEGRETTDGAFGSDGMARGISRDDALNMQVSHSCAFVAMHGGLHPGFLAAEAERPTLLGASSSAAAARPAGSASALAEHAASGAAAPTDTAAASSAARDGPTAGAVPAIAGDRSPLPAASAARALAGFSGASALRFCDVLHSAFMAANRGALPLPQLCASVRVSWAGPGVDLSDAAIEAAARELVTLCPGLLALTAGPSAGDAAAAAPAPTVSYARAEPGALSRLKAAVRGLGGSLPVRR